MLAQATMSQQWRLDLTNDEFLLILKALGGRLQVLPSQDQVSMAKELGDRLTEQRVHSLRDAAATADRLAAHLREAQA